ncbi:MAG: GspH/FimT family pseudopilin [Desulfobacterales bacterium]|nr:GspH/FimT family pseudopilin [Desulfobacterales bacterium]
MRTRKKHRLNSSGFTFTELIVVIAVIAILSAITVSVFSRWLPQYRLKQAARDLYSTMQSVKMAAIKTNQSADIDFSTAPSHQYQYSISGVTKTVLLSEYGSGVKFQDEGGALTFTASPITFDGRGFGQNVGNVYLSNESNTDYYLVTLSTAGAVSLQKWDGAAYK